MFLHFARKIFGYFNGIGSFLRYNSINLSDRASVLPWGGRGYGGIHAGGY
jgi:hypothetical protein